MPTLYRLLFVSMVALSCPSLAHADLLSNPYFDNSEQLSDWIVWNLPPQWDPLDEDGSANSGSAVITHDTTGNGGVKTFLSQCLEVPSGRAHVYGASVYTPAGQIEDFGGGRVQIRFYESLDCFGYTLDSDFSPSASSVGAWETVSGSFVVPPGTAGVRFGLAIHKLGGVEEDVSVHFDNAFLFDPDLIFADQLESD